MKDNRAYDAGKGMKDSPDSIRRAGGDDPRRYDAKIIIERKIFDHDMSGYNHNATANQPANGGHENEMYMAKKDREVPHTGMIQPDGLFKY